MTDPEHPPIDTCFHIHMVSDSTGETLMEVMRASVAQFENTNPLEHLYAKTALRMRVMTFSFFLS